MAFHDHFSAVAAGYAAFRPGYPDALFAELARLAPARDTAWDCATGSGQAAVGLARHFRTVIATDASAEQIAAATRHERVTYRVAPAETSGLAEHSVRLVTVAQGLHWFDIPRFFSEVKRVLSPGGLVAVWCYGLPTLHDAIDGIVGAFYAQEVGPYWPPERALVEARYRTIDFPFEEIELPEFRMEADLSLEGFAGYLRTWSAVAGHARARGSDPVGPLVRRIAPHWGDPAHTRRVRWPLSVRAGYCTSAQ